LATYHTSLKHSTRTEARRLLFAIVTILIVITATIGSIIVLGVYDFSKSTLTGQSYTYTIVNGSVAIPAGNYHYYGFDIPHGETSLSITGSFIASGGTANDIEVLVMDQAHYGTWMSGYQVSTYFDSGRVSNGNIYAPLPGSGTYYLIYSNIFSTTYDKTVQTNAMLHYRG
jgi:hypothetical protein